MSTSNSVQLATVIVFYKKLQVLVEESLAMSSFVFPHLVAANWTSVMDIFQACNTECRKRKKPRGIIILWVKVNSFSYP